MSKKGVLAQIAELGRLDRPALLERWKSLFGTEPPRYSKQLLVARLAYRVQELAYGGLSDVAKAKLGEGMPIDEQHGVRLARRGRRAGTPVVGTRLVREWQGERYEVVVTDRGFALDGRPFRSLSAAARHITGTRWNGRVFFGLKKPGDRGRN